MANEFRKVTDQNGVNHPVTDQLAQNGIIANTKLIKDTVGWSGKNKLPNVYTGGSSNGITYTVGADKSISASNNTATGLSGADVNTITLPAGDYILSGCPSGGSTSTYYMNAIFGGADHFDTGEGVSFTLSAATSIRVVFRILSGVSGNGKVFKPMIRPADILDNTYEPYFGSTAFPRSEQAVLGAKNLFVPVLNTTEQDGVTWTRNVNDTYTVNGTNSKNVNNFIQLGEFDASKYSGTVKFTCCPSGASASTYFVQLYDKTASQWTSIYDYGDGFTIDCSTNHLYWLECVIAGSAQVDNVLLKPMISYDGGEFVPPAMTNRELTEMYGKIQYLDLTTDVVDQTGDFSVEKSNIPSGDYIVFLRCQAKVTGVLNSEINSRECGIFADVSIWQHYTSFAKITVTSNKKLTFHSKSYTTATYANVQIALIPIE